MSGLLINDNPAAVESYDNLDATNSALSHAVGELSSGLQIQTAADDPSGYRKEFVGLVWKARTISGK